MKKPLMLENEQFDPGEILCISEGFETDEMILCESDSCVVYKLSLRMFVTYLVRTPT